MKIIIANVIWNEKEMSEANSQNYMFTSIESKYSPSVASHSIKVNKSPSFREYFILMVSLDIVFGTYISLANVVNDSPSSKYCISKLPVNICPTTEYVVFFCKLSIFKMWLSTWQIKFRKINYSLIMKWHISVNMIWTSRLQYKPFFPENFRYSIVSSTYTRILWADLAVGCLDRCHYRPSYSELQRLTSHVLGKSIESSLCCSFVWVRVKIHLNGCKYHNIPIIPRNKTNYNS